MAVLVIFICVINTYHAGAFQLEDSYYMRDISGHWAENDLNDLADMGILKGNNDMNANPDQPISRAEFIALLVRGLNYGDQPQGGMYFKDVSSEDWYYNVVNVAKEKGITVGNGSGYFFPNSQITREEIVLMLIRALQLNNGQSSSASKNFKDIAGSYPYKTELNLAINSGIINGYEDNTFRPGNNASRAEAAVMIKRMLGVSDALTSDDIDSNKADIQDLVKEYINEYSLKKNNQQTDIQYNLDHSIGKEYDTNESKADIIALYKQEGIDVKEDISNISINDLQLTGQIAQVKVYYDVTYTRSFSDGSNRVESYKMEKPFSLRKLDGSWKVYNTEERLYRDDKISLAWEQVDVRTPDMSGVQSMDGLDVISPTWFELRTDQSSMGVTANDPVVYSDWQGSIHMVDMGADSYVQWAHPHGYDIWGAFRNGFDTDISNRVLNSQDARSKMIEQVLEYANKYQLDGINVDFENMYYDDRYVFSQFVRELALALREEGLITSVDVTKIEPGSWTWSLCYDRKELGKAADYIALMAYDENGSWSTVSGSVAQLSWVENGLKGVMQQVPAEKILLGVPFYTRLWEETNGKVTKTSAISMQTAQNLIQQNSANVSWDSSSGQNLAVYSSGSKIYKIWVEDAASIGLKVSLVNKYGLAGAAGWRRGFETSDIWTVISNALQ